MERMRDPDPALRPAAWEAMFRISEFLQATPPQALYYPPHIAKKGVKDTAPANVPLPPSPEDAPRVLDPADISVSLSTTVVPPDTISADTSRASE